MDRLVREAENRLRTLGEPVYAGITSKAFPYGAVGEARGVLKNYFRAQHATVWYEVFGKGPRKVVFMIEALS